MYATFQTIKSIEIHPNADSLEMARVLGWWVVVKKGEFKTGDRCVYISVDTIITPEGQNNPAFKFLENYNYRIKTIKLRGQISQGLIMPMSVLPGVEFKEGKDVSALLGVAHYEKPVSPDAKEVAGGFPSFVAKTDEERVQNIPEIIRYSDITTLYVSEKVDGTSGTYAKRAGEKYICQRNYRLKDTYTENKYWQMWKKYNLDTVLPNEMVVQGEIAGPGIQGNKLQLPECKLFVFNVGRIIGGTHTEMLHFDAMMQFCAERGLDTVPIVDQWFSTRDYDVDSIVKYADGPSLLNPSKKREGVVFRGKAGETWRNGRLSFKAISNEYLLKHGE